MNGDDFMCDESIDGPGDDNKQSCVVSLPNRSIDFTPILTVAQANMLRSLLPAKEDSSGHLILTSLGAQKLLMRHGLHPAKMKEDMREYNQYPSDKVYRSYLIHQVIQLVDAKLQEQSLAHRSLQRLRRAKTTTTTPKKPKKKRVVKKPAASTGKKKKQVRK
jgi:hypothetical protein